MLKGLRTPRNIYTDRDCKRMFQGLEEHLKDQGLKSLPHYSSWESQPQSDQVIELIQYLSDSIHNYKGMIHKESSKDTIEFDPEVEDGIRRHEKSLKQKEEELAQIRAEIKNVERLLKEDKRKFLSKQKIKLNEMSRLDRLRNAKRIVV